jgi:hypothetical protein
MIAKLVADLYGRLKRQTAVAEALEVAAAPTDQTLVKELPRFTILQTAARQHAADLRQVSGLAEIISDVVSRPR